MFTLYNPLDTKYSHWNISQSSAKKNLIDSKNKINNKNKINIVIHKTKTKRNLTDKKPIYQLHSIIWLF